MPSRFGDLVIFPSNDSVTRPPFPPRGLSGWFPRFLGTMRVLRRPEPIPTRFVSFACRYRSYVRRFAPTGRGRPLPVGLDFGLPEPTRDSAAEISGSPRFLGGPPCAHALG